MISDNARISLSDGTQQTAMEVLPGREVLSFRQARMSRARVLDRRVEVRSDTVCLILGNGQKLCGSRDQLVGIQRQKAVHFIPLGEVEIGDRLRGERAGVPCIVNVIGLMFSPRREVRLVGLTLDRDKNFVAEGVLCR